MKSTAHGISTAETFRDGYVQLLYQLLQLTLIEFLSWVHTGDEVTINERKEVFVVDRIKELIKVKAH